MSELTDILETCIARGESLGYEDDDLRARLAALQADTGDVSDELRACPFCGEHQYLELRTDKDVLWWVYCNNCGAHGYASDRRHRAIESWNTRTADALVEAAEAAYKAYHHRMFTGFGTQESINAHAEAMEFLRSALAAHKDATP